MFFNRNETPYRMVLTKTDYLFADEVAYVVELIRREIGQNKDLFKSMIQKEPFLILASSKRKSGINALRLEIAQHSLLDKEYWRKKVSKNVSFYI